MLIIPRYSKSVVQTHAVMKARVTGGMERYHVSSCIPAMVGYSEGHECGLNRGSLCCCAHLCAAYAC